MIMPNIGRITILTAFEPVNWRASEHVNISAPIFGFTGPTHFSRVLQHLIVAPEPHFAYSKSLLSLQLASTVKLAAPLVVVVVVAASAIGNSPHAAIMPKKALIMVLLIVLFLVLCEVNKATTAQKK
jgi:hypothetical protein